MTETRTIKGVPLNYNQTTDTYHALVGSCSITILPRTHACNWVLRTNKDSAISGRTISSSGTVDPLEATIEVLEERLDKIFPQNKKVPGVPESMESIKGPTQCVEETPRTDLGDKLEVIYTQSTTFPDYPVAVEVLFNGKSILKGHAATMADATRLANQYLTDLFEIKAP